MDHTKTPFGGRLLRNWVAHPLTDRRRINERLDAVEEMVAAGSDVEQGGQLPTQQLVAWTVSAGCCSAHIAHALCMPVEATTQSMSVLCAAPMCMLARQQQPSVELGCMVLLQHQ